MKCCDEQRDVFGTIAQRRHQHPDHRDAVVEILAKLLGGDLGAQVPVGRREHPHRGGRVAGAADRPDALLVDRAQQRRLHRRRQLADLVEEQRAAVRLLEGAAPIGHGAGERAADVAEQRRFDLLVGDSAAIEDDEGAVLAGAVAVNLLGEQLLARSRLPFDEHRRVGGGDVVEQTEQPAQLRVATDQRTVALRIRGAEIERLLVGDELQHGLADGDLRTEAERQLVEPRPLHERTIGRPEIARDHAFRPRLYAEVAAGDGRVGERHVAPAPRAEREGHLPDLDRLAAVGTLDDQQPPAAQIAE